METEPERSLVEVGCQYNVCGNLIYLITLLKINHQMHTHQKRAMMLHGVYKLCDMLIRVKHHVTSFKGCAILHVGRCYTNLSPLKNIDVSFPWAKIYSINRYTQGTLSETVQPNSSEKNYKENHKSIMESHREYPEHIYNKIIPAKPFNLASADLNEIRD